VRAAEAMTISVMTDPWFGAGARARRRRKSEAGGTLTKPIRGVVAADRGALRAPGRPPVPVASATIVRARSIVVAAPRRKTVFLRRCAQTRPLDARNRCMDGVDTDKAAPVIIKKYANRRLYNTAKSSYVTLDHLAAMVRVGEDFVVYDAKTGEDITRSVLTQIIFEEEAKGASMLPANFLRQIIRLYGDTLQGVVPGYLEASMDTFARNQEKMREQLRVAFGANPAFGAFESMTRANMEWFQNAMRMFNPYAAAAAAALPRPAARRDDEAAPVPAAAPDEEIEALKHRLADMQKQLDKIAKGG
jgi:polyhydroxyalkanoate synthesis repressor PhaR